MIAYIICILSGVAAIGNHSQGPDIRVGWYEIGIHRPSVAAQALEQSRAQLRQLPIQWIDETEWKRSLREHDRQNGILAQAQQQLDQARTHHLALALDLAIQSYSKAIETLHKGFAVYYDPQLVAEPLLGLAAAQHESAQPEKAQATFKQVIRLAGHLELSGGYFSPRIRKAFAKAKQELLGQGPTLPKPVELAKICKTIGLDAIMLADQERQGERVLVRLSLLDATSQRFVAIESAMLQEDAINQVADQLAQRMLPKLTASFGIKLTSTTNQVTDTTPEKPRKKKPISEHTQVDKQAWLDPIDVEKKKNHWALRHWWIWPVAASVIIISVTLPLTVFREDVVDIQVHK